MEILNRESTSSVLNVRKLKQPVESDKRIDMAMNMRSNRDRSKKFPKVNSRKHVNSVDFGTQTQTGKRLQSGSGRTDFMKSQSVQTHHFELPSCRWLPNKVVNKRPTLVRASNQDLEHVEPNW